MTSDELAEHIGKALAAHDQRTKRASPTWAFAGSGAGAIISAILSYATITGALEARIDELGKQMQAIGERFAYHVDQHSVGAFDRRGG